MPSAFGLPVRSSNRYEAPAAMQLLMTATATQTSSLTLTGFSSASYKSYQLVLSGWKAATSGGVDVYCFFSSDGGKTYPSTLTHTVMQYTSGTTPTAVMTLGNNFAYVFQGLTDDARCTMGGVLIFTYGPDRYSDTVLQKAKSQLNGTLGGVRTAYSQSVSVMCAQQENDASLNSEVNAMKFAMSSGNIATGTIRLYGIT